MLVSKSYAAPFDSTSKKLRKAEGLVRSESGLLPDSKGGMQASVKCINKRELNSLSP